MSVRLKASKAVPFRNEVSMEMVYGDMRVWALVAAGFVAAMVIDSMLGGKLSTAIS